MNKTRLVLAGCFVMTLAAGASVGLLLAQGQQPKPRRESWLTSKLDLTPHQRQQMEQIWSQAIAEARRYAHQRTELAQQRDEAIAALLSEEQMAAHEAIIEEYERASEALSQQRRKVFEQARASTRQLLSAEQVAKYDELMKRSDGGGHRSHRGRGRWHRSEGRADSQPTDQTQSPHVEGQE